LSFNTQTIIPSHVLSLSVQVQVQQSRYRPGQAQRVDRGTALRFRDLGTRNGCVVSIRPRPL
jgi:hypothetical protein